MASPKTPEPCSSNQVLSLRQLIWAALGLSAAVFFIVSMASIAGRITVSHAVGELSGHVAAVQDDVEALRRAITDQETGQRGFMLTGNPVSLEPYQAGVESEEQSARRLREQLSRDARASAQLESSLQAVSAWRSGAAEPQIAERRAGPIAPDRQAMLALRGKILFDESRLRVRVLAQRARELEQSQLRRIQSAQRTANAVQIGGAAVLAAVLVAAVIAVRRCVTSPVNVLVEQVKSVADGNYDHPIHAVGPRETTELARAAEQMRESLRASTDRLVDAELRDEQARIAADLHDRVIQRVFGLGLSLTSASARRDPDLQGFIDETDAIIHDLRDVVFNLNQSMSQPVPSIRMCSAIIDLVEESAPALGLMPTLDFEGPIDDGRIRPKVYAAVLAVIRESLSNVARHARATAAAVKVVASDSELRITIQDNGIGVTAGDVMGNGRQNIHTRAQNLGGAATIHSSGDGRGAVVEWTVPLPPV